MQVVLPDDHSSEDNPAPEVQDLRMELKLKNNVLYRVIFDRYSSVLGFCKAHPQAQGYYPKISALINFRLSPLKRNGEYRKVCIVLSSLLGKPLEELFPQHLYDSLVGKETQKVLEVSSFTALPAMTQRELLRLPAPEEDGPEKQVDDILLRESIEKILETFPYRSREIIRLRFGLSTGNTCTLEEVGRIFKIGVERVRQIEGKVLQKLRKNRAFREKLETFL